MNKRVVVNFEKMKFLIPIIILSVISGCRSSKLPLEKYNQYEYQTSYIFEDNQLKVELKNPLNCPLRIWIFNANKGLQDNLNEFNPIELESKSDSLIVFHNIYDFDNILSFSSRLGSTSKKIEPIKLELPFPENKEYKVIQGNNTNFTHNSDWSRYAIDFNLKINDTICSATDGYVVGLVDKYEFGGKEEEWKPFANYITIYEPNSGLFTQYVHLVKNGSLVKLGDKVESGQPIALSGNTGHSNMEHLHFNCLIPVNSEEGLKSIPIEFIEGYIGEELKKGDIVKK